MFWFSLFLAGPAYFAVISFQAMMKSNRKTIEYSPKGYLFQVLMIACEIPLFCYVGLPLFSMFLWSISDGSFFAFCTCFLVALAHPLTLLGMFSTCVLNAYLEEMLVNKASAAEIKELYSKYIVFKNKEFENTWSGKRIPMEIALEAYQDQKMDFKPDCLTVFRARHDLFAFTFTAGHWHSVVADLLRRVYKHDSDADHADISDVYNKGNDFYGWFLCDRNIYSSGIWDDSKEEGMVQKLENAQWKKLNHLCGDLALMKPGMEHLDLGCGWGAMLLHATKHFKVKSTGVTLSKEQAKYIECLAPKYMADADNQNHERNMKMKEEAIKEADKASKQKDQETVKKINENLKVRIMNAWDLEDVRKFDVITCLEMSEHIGIRDYQKFMHKVRNILKDDGVFYLQIAGLRRNWQFEDMIWGLYMNKYIFPGAEASCPLYWDVEQLERAGWDVRYIENRGFHYGLTICTWYHNWVANKDKVVKKYGEWAWRNWAVFLAWSYLIAMQGSSTVWMIAMGKAFPFDERSRSTPPKPDSAYDPENGASPHFGINRAEMWIDGSRPPFTGKSKAE